MNRIAEFKKISKEQFLADGARLLPDYSEAELSQMYEDIRLPKRATSGSAARMAQFTAISGRKIPN